MIVNIHSRMFGCDKIHVAYNSVKNFFIYFIKKNKNYVCNKYIPVYMKGTGHMSLVDIYSTCKF